MAVQLAPTDPNVRLPAAVVAATQRALAMQEQQRREAAGEPDPAPEAPPANPQPQTATPSAPQTPEPDLEHKLKSAEGRLAKAERERQALAQRLAALEAQRPAPQQQQQQPRQQPMPEIKKLVTAEEEEEFGQEFLGVVGRKAREELAGEMFKLQRQLNELSGSVNSVSTVVVTSEREKMKTQLDEALPPWRQINYDERFLSWLALPDPFSGVTRHELLKSAYSSNNAARVLTFFKAFVAEEAAGSPPSPGSETPPTPTPSGGNGSQPGKIPLESLAAPGRASPAATQVPADKPIITRQQITQFYADVAAGRYRGREAEKLENDAAIILASNEGRIA